MKNNKIVPREEIKEGMRVKIAFPTYYAHHKKDKHKTYSWFKGIITYKTDLGTFIVNVKKLGRYTIWYDQEYKMVKCL